MVKIIYSGDISPCRISIYGAQYYWSDGEVKELDEFHAKKLVGDNAHFKYVDKVMTTAVKSPEKKIEENFDKMNKDELLDYTAKKNIKADYTMTKEELKAIVKK